MKTKFLVLSLYPSCYQSHIKIPCYVSRLHSLIKFCDPSWFCSVYTLDLRFYVVINLVLLKYCLTMLFKKIERERWKDSMPKKHDPKKEWEREKMACQRSMTQQIKLDMKRSMCLSVHYPNQFVDISINLWIQFLTLQQIWVKLMPFYPIRQNSTYTVKAGEVE